MAAAAIGSPSRSLLATVTRMLDFHMNVHRPKHMTSTTSASDCGGAKSGPALATNREQIDATLLR